MTVEVRDIAPGLWLWRQPHPDWEEGLDWEPEVTSVVAESRGEVVLLDPLAPPPGEHDVWDPRRAAADRDRDPQARPRARRRPVRALVRRAGVRAGGVLARRRARHQLERVDPGDELPGGLVAQYDGRDRVETPVYLPEQRALVFADGLTAPGGVLRVWGTPWYRERTLPAFRAMLGLPFEHVIVSHGEPVHGRADFEAALEREPWSS